MQTPDSFTILAIETSCDETAASVLHFHNNTATILSSIVASQIHLHAQYGGVVPNLAAREHVANSIPVIQKALDQAKKTPATIDVISVTNAPGLIPALLVGVTTAKSLSYAWQKPLLGIHHIEGHIYANFVEDAEKISFPILCLIVSGGHTQLVLMRDHFQYEIIGETQDDAVGEAFDKVARLLNLPYPGGPAISQRAAVCKDNSPLHRKELEVGFPPKSSFTLPRPMLNSGDLNFSYSGLKTAVLTLVKKNEDKLQDESFVNEIAYEFQEAATDVLVKKTLKATEEYHPKTVLLAGGVSANTRLREKLKSELITYDSTIHFSAPPMAYCIDNAAMIATAAAYRWKYMNKDEKKSAKSCWGTLQAFANKSLNS